MDGLLFLVIAESLCLIVLGWNLQTKEEKWLEKGRLSAREELKCCEHNPCPKRPQGLAAKDYYDKETPWVCPDCRRWWQCVYCLPPFYDATWEELELVPRVQDNRREDGTYTQPRGPETNYGSSCPCGCSD